MRIVVRTLLFFEPVYPPNNVRETPSRPSDMARATTLDGAVMAAETPAIAAF